MPRSNTGLPKLPKLPKPQAPQPPPGLKKFGKNLKGVPGPQSTDPVGLADPEILAVLQNTLAHHLQVMAMYASDDGVMEHVFYPLALGTRDGEHRVWGYQFAGGSGVGWRCFVVAKLSNIQGKPGPWHVPDNDPDPDRCMDHILQRAT